MNEQQEELLRLIKHVRGWVKDNLEKKNPELAETIRFQLANLNRLAHHQPDQVSAALLGANTIWYMLFEDAGTGYKVRHGNKTRQYEGEVSVDAVVQALKVIRNDNPTLTKTKAVPKVAKKLECSQRTVWSKLKEAKN